VLSSSWEISHNPDFGMDNKNSVPKRKTHKTTDASSTIPPDSPLVMVLKGFPESAL
jgi:hypothetical protein